MAKETKPGMKIDEALIRQLAGLLDETGLGEIEVQEGERLIRVAKGGSSYAVTAAPHAAPAPAAAAVVAVPAVEDYAQHPGAVTSPMVGVCYLSPDPKSPPFFSEGDTVTEGSTLLLIEAMKVFNPIVAPKSGKIAKILVMDGMPVEFGEPLIIIE